MRKHLSWKQIDRVKFIRRLVLVHLQHRFDDYLLPDLNYFSDFFLLRVSSWQLKSFSSDYNIFVDEFSYENHIYMGESDWSSYFQYFTLIFNILSYLINFKSKNSKFSIFV